MGGKTITWAATPEAKAKLAKGYTPPQGKKWGCKKMEEAARKAEQAMAGIRAGQEAEEAAVGGNDKGIEEQDT